MKRFIFENDVFDDYNNWFIVDKRIFKKIVELLNDIKRDSYKGLGKPEPLKHELAGYWSRRITDEHRLVYKVSGNDIIIFSCKGHYV
jgi:toxin YoeB